MAKAIKVENLSKVYQLGDFGTGTISRDLERFWARVRGKEDPFLKIGEINDRTTKGESDVVWSLKDLNFEIEQGDAIGIIGRNGAGKSTLLKVLSRVTTPTTGSVKVKGRIASLLEVGTGFHPELTGRENIYLNGAILGMRKAEIKRKFDEIVDFSGVERYVDTPVKRYSSGMYVRLAFAVAAHLESEILIVDEVLAVGDAEFQKKCLGKMGDVNKGEGRTVLFVSHNVGIINQLCTHTIVMNNGEIQFYGQSDLAIATYLKNLSNVSTTRLYQPDLLPDTNHFVKVYNASNNLEEKQEFGITEKINLFVEVNIALWLPSLELAVSLYDKFKRRIFTIHEPLTKYYEGNPLLKFKISIPSDFLTPGNYSWLMCINHPGVDLYDLQDDICNFSIIDTGSDFARYTNNEYGAVFVNHQIQLL